MDFALTDEQQQLRDLAATLLRDRVTQKRHADLEAAGEWFDEPLWRELAGSGLLGVALPEEYGGGGAGFVEVCLLLEQVGATLPQVPVWATVVLAAMPIAQFGTREQKERDLAAVTTGDAVLTAALTEPLTPDPAAVTTTATPDGRGWRLTGTKTCVPAGPIARRIVVPARTPDGTTVFLVDPDGDGIGLEPQTSTAGEPQALLRLDSAYVGADDVLGDPRRGAEVVTWTAERALTGLAAMQAGITDRVLRMAADYTVQRRQFGRPVATFQAVAHRLADAYTDAEAVRLSMLQAAWRIVEGLPADDAVAVAKWWACEGGHRAVHAAQHVHGGAGVDLDYPLHRYFRWSRQIELTLGGATSQLLRIGDRLAAEPA